MLFTSIFVAVLTVALLHGPKLLLEPMSEQTHRHVAALAQPSGMLVETTRGKTHCHVREGRGRGILLLHGISISSYSMSDLLERFSAAGLRIIACDFYGRGHSTAPLVTYNNELYLEQMSDIFETFNTDGAMDIVALSMGGAVAVSFCARHPTKCASVNLLAPAGVPFPLPIVGYVLKVEPIGRVVLGSPLGQYIAGSRIEHAFGDSVQDQESVALLKQELHFHTNKPGFPHAISSTVANFVQLQNATVEFDLLGQQRDRCVTVFWGTNDHTIPFSSSPWVREKIPHANLVTFKGVGHGLNNQRAAEIVEHAIKCIEMEKSNGMTLSL